MWGPEMLRRLGHRTSFWLSASLSLSVLFALPSCDGRSEKPNAIGGGLSSGGDDRVVAPPPPGVVGGTTGGGPLGGQGGVDSGAAGQGEPDAGPPPEVTAEVVIDVPVPTATVGTIDRFAPDGRVTINAPEELKAGAVLSKLEAFLTRTSAQAEVLVSGELAQDRVEDVTMSDDVIYFSQAPRWTSVRCPVTLTLCLSSRPPSVAPRPKPRSTSCSTLGRLS